MDHNTYLTTEEWQALLAQRRSMRLRDITLPLPRWPAPDSTTLQRRMHAFAVAMGGWEVFSLARSDRAKVSKSGYPDDTWVGNGRHIAIEYKREHERVTIPQQQWLEAFWRNDPHVECWIAWPSDEPRLVAWLREERPAVRDRTWMVRLPLPCRCAQIA